MVGRRGENFGVEKRWKKYIYAGREDEIFVHPENGLNRLITTGALVTAGSLQPWSQALGLCGYGMGMGPLV